MKLRGTLTIVRALPGQRRAHYRPREWMSAERDRRVRELVRHAAEQVPYYRELFAREGIDPRELRTASDLARLPLADRTTLAEHEAGLRSETIPDRDLLRLHTSGTVAPALHVTHDRRALLETIAHSERDRAVESELCGQRYRYVVAEVWAGRSTVGNVQEFFGRSSFRPLRPRVHPIALETPVAEVVRRLNEARAVVLRANGSYLEALFAAIHARGLPLRPPRVVVYTGDTMTAEGRRLIEEHFGVPVISRYGATEVFRIGFTCEERDGFHLHDDLCHVRLVGPDGRDVPPGDRGDVVVANLVNRGTVLLNYRLGDTGRFVAGPCPCGRTSRRLALLDAFKAAVIELDGRLVHQYTIRDALGGIEGIRRFQLVQQAPQEFELRLATRDRAAYERLAPAAAARVGPLLHPSRLETVFSPQLVPLRGERLPFVVPLVGA